MRLLRRDMSIFVDFVKRDEPDAALKDCSVGRVVSDAEGHMDVRCSLYTPTLC